MIVEDVVVDNFSKDFVGHSGEVVVFVMVLKVDASVARTPEERAQAEGKTVG